MNSVEERVIRIIAEKLDKKVEEIGKEMSLMPDLGADSLDTVEIIMALEDEFSGLAVPDEEAEKMNTVQDAINFVESHVQKEGSQ